MIIAEALLKPNTALFSVHPRTSDTARWRSVYLGCGSVRRSVSSAVYQSLVVALVLLTRLNYGKFGNAAQAGLPSYLHRRLQFVLNAAA